MKYAVVLCDGMADTPVAQLNNQTPMTVADKPCMNELAKYSEIGLLKTVAEGLKPGSDVANLSVMGYEPAKYYSGRSPLEAASIGIDLKDTDVTLRCNLVTLTDEAEYSDKTILDYCADDISTAEAKILVEYVQEKLGNDIFKFYPGVSYRHCLVWSNGNPQPGVLTPPHDITGNPIKEYIPKGDFVDGLYELMVKSYELLKDHPVNKERISRGKKPANSIWLWGEGTKPLLDSFANKYNVKGSVISAVDLLKGIGICAEMATPEVEGATGYIDTNFEGKLKAAINEFERGQDFVYIHVEAPDECGHRGEVENKVKAIELIDSKILAPLVEYFNNCGDDYKILICPDHPTPLAIKTHTNKPVPYLVYTSNKKIDSGISVFDENTAESTGIYNENGFTLMGEFVKA